MHLVAVAQSILTADDKAAALVRVLGITPSEARQHSLIGLPRAVASRANLAEARALVDKLDEVGLNAVVVGPDDVVTDARRFLARTFAVTEERIVANRKDGAQAQLEWGDIAAVVVGLRKTGAPFVDIFDGGGAVLSIRERDSLFDGTNLHVAGARAAVAAVGLHARQRSNARVDDRMLKPGAIPALLGGFSSMTNADDWAVTLLGYALRL